LLDKIFSSRKPLFKGKELRLPQEFDSYVMENVLFKISYPAEFHAQTAVEAAVILHPETKDKGFNNIDKIVITTISKVVITKSHHQLLEIL